MVTLRLAVPLALLLAAACSDQPTGAELRTPDEPARHSVNSSSASINYHAHVEDHGWLGWVGPGETTGTVGQARQMEALEINFWGSAGPAAKVCAEAHVQDHGWMGETCGTSVIVGTTGQARQMEAIRIRVADAPDVSICYRAHIENFGWLDWQCNGQVAGTVGDSLQMEAIQIRLVKPFYAWTSFQTGQPYGIPLQGDPHMGQHASYDRQLVWAGNYEKYHRVDEQFVLTNAGKGMIYIIGDEPDHWNSTAGPWYVYTPAQYAQVFHEAVTHIRGLDSSARFSNGGITPRGSTPNGPGYLHWIEYADAFISAYRGITGQDPPVYEWRFHALGMSSGAGFATLMNEAAAWAAARGSRVFVGSVSGPESILPDIVNHVKADSRITGAAWWSYDPASRTNYAWPYALHNGTSLTSLGQSYVQLMK